MASLLKLFGLVCMLVGALHVFLGLQAEQLLGAGLSEATIANASLDSQNRFYGAAFILFGLVAWVSATDLRKYALIFRLQMAAFFLGGIARLISILLHGLPSLPIQLLTVSELLIPPIFIWWHFTSRRQSSDDPDS